MIKIKNMLLVHVYMHIHVYVHNYVGICYVSAWTENMAQLHIAGKFREFGKSSVIHQPSKLVLNLLADILIRQMLAKSKFAKLSCYIEI